MKPQVRLKFPPHFECWLDFAAGGDMLIWSGSSLTTEMKSAEKSTPSVGRDPSFTCTAFVFYVKFAGKHFRHEKLDIN